MPVGGKGIPSQSTAFYNGIMNDSHPCPKCGEVLEVPVEMLGRPVRCGACSTVFTPGQPPATDDFAAEFDRSTPRRRQRPSPDEPAVSSGGARRLAFLMLGMFGLISCTCCGGIGYFVFAMFNPKWEQFESPAGEFTAKFPGPTSTASRFTGRGGERADAILARRKFIQEDYFVYFVPLTKADTRKEPERILDELANGLMSQSPGAEEFRPRVQRSHAGFDALDMCIEHPDDRFTQARIVLTDTKAYVVGVTGPGEPDHKMWVEDFLNAFQPKAAGQPAGGRGNPFRD